jgi:branched-chain amino acid transport system ATP-binding protein
MMLVLSGVTAGYGRSAVLHTASLQVTSGAITSLIGANGAGKTTTLRAIVNHVRTFDGAITFCGESIRGLRTDRIVDRGISLVPEGRRIFEGLTVLENLKVGAYRCPDRVEYARRLDVVFGMFPRLSERKNQMGTSLSGGEQQMLAIGRSLMSSPKMLLLDEPSMGLAPKLVDQVFAAIEKLRAGGTSILLVEQNARRAIELANYVYVLESGRIAMHGRSADILKEEKVAATYLGEG